ncbi:MAG: hypothetical protein ACYCS9_05855 [Candidatus Dormibacteria bacterium]
MNVPQRHFELIRARPERGGDLGWWIATLDPEPEGFDPRPVDAEEGAELLAQMAGVRDGQTACPVAARYGFLEGGEIVQSASSGYFAGEPVARWLRTGELVRKHRGLLEAAERVRIGLAAERDRRSLRTFLSDAVRSERPEGRPVGPGISDEELVKWARAEMAVEIAAESWGHFGIESLLHGVAAPLPADIYGSVLWALGDELAASVAGAGLSVQKRCHKCGKPIAARRLTRKWCSERCRSAAAYARRATEARLSGAGEGAG